MVGKWTWWVGSSLLSCGEISSMLWNGVCYQCPGQDLNYGRYLAATDDVYGFSLLPVVLLLIMTASCYVFPLPYIKVKWHVDNLWLTIHFMIISMFCLLRNRFKHELSLEPSGKRSQYFNVVSSCQIVTDKWSFWPNFQFQWKLVRL